jgi:hypothetical protein
MWNEKPAFRSLDALLVQGESSTQRDGVRDPFAGEGALDARSLSGRRQESQVLFRPPAALISTPMPSPSPAPQVRLDRAVPRRRPPGRAALQLSGTADKSWMPSARDASTKPLASTGATVHTVHSRYRVRPVGAETESDERPPVRLRAGVEDKVARLKTASLSGPAQGPA